ncbi:MAG: hypothetical protein C0402_02525 [Thermodesulfovibrio sp.]|nr:hypothetical protein [Thermodesulfovibrio sp.]
MLATVNKNEYVNDFLYFVVRSEVRGDKEVLIMCSGVNLSRFSPITRNRYGIGGNPILSGLQLVKYDLCSLAMSRGAVPKDIWGYHCDGIAPTKDAWYAEPLQLENTENLPPEEIITFGVRNLLQRVISCSRLGYEVPETVPSPAELQVYLEDMCRAMPQAA